MRDNERAASMLAENFRIRREEPSAHEVSRAATSLRSWPLRRALEAFAAFALIVLLLTAVVALRAYLFVPRW